MEQLRQDVDSLKEEMDSALKTISGMASDISAIKTALVGNPIDKDDKGLMGYKKIIEDLVKFKDRMVYILVGLSVGAGFGIDRIIQLIAK